MARLMRNTGSARILVPIGLALLIFGIVVLVISPKNYKGTAEATVKNVDYNTDDDGNKTYDVDYVFEVDGKEYPGSAAGLDKEYSAGDSIKVYYDEADPNKNSVSGSAGIIPVIMIIVGAAVIALGIFLCVRNFRKSRELDEKTKAAAGSDKMPEILPLPKEELTEYYVSYDGKMLRPGYTVDDKDRKPIYEMAMTKNALAGSRTFTFTNQLSGETVEHQVGHTFTATYNDELFSVNSSFKFDGKNVWDVIHDRGIRIRTDLGSKFPNITYIISKDARFLATVETCGRYVHEDEAAEHKLNIPVGRYYYRVWTDGSDNDGLFLTVFAISETEQTIVE